MPDITLREVKHIGSWSAHFYEDKDGNVVAQECSAQDRLDLREPDAPKPDVPGRWLYTSGPMRKFDTPSGFLEDGTYCRLTTATTLVGIGGDWHVVPPEAVVDGVLVSVPPRAAAEGDTLESLAETL